MKLTQSSSFFGCLFHSINKSIAQATTFEFMNTAYCRATWWANLISEHSWMLSRLQHCLSCTEHSLSSKLNCHLSWQTLFHTTVGQCFDDREYLQRKITSNSRTQKQLLNCLTKAGPQPAKAPAALISFSGTCWATPNEPRINCTFSISGCVTLLPGV